MADGRRAHSPSRKLSSRAWGLCLGTEWECRASGRTDAGVHAKGQVVNFHTRTSLTPDRILKGLNSLLPDDIVVLRAEEVDESFHARFSAVSKVYEYHILNRAVPSALLRNYVWHVRRPLALEPMEECLEMICGRNNFSAFMASGSQASSTERNMLRAEFERPWPDRLKFTYEANGFLRRMVRNLTGTIVEVGKGKRTVDDFERIIGSGRPQASRNDRPWTWSISRFQSITRIARDNFTRGNKMKIIWKNRQD